MSFTFDLVLASSLRLHYRLYIISLYRSDLGIFLNLGLLGGQNDNIIPALRTVITLWSAHLAPTLSAPQQTPSPEPALLSRTLHLLSDALSVTSSQPEPRFHMQILQTEVLLVYYFQRLCQIPNAQYHAGAALSLAVGIGLHMQTGDTTSTGLLNLVSTSHPRLPPATDWNESQERVDAWWTIYSLAIFLEASYSGSSEINTVIRITTPWPSFAQPKLVSNTIVDHYYYPEYFQDQGGVGSRNTSVVVQDTVTQFLAAPSFTFQLETAIGLQARASVLLGEALSITTSHSRGDLHSPCIEIN